jgi:uncharacterized protein YutE (UPF0331/DUF86 family)
VNEAYLLEQFRLMQDYLGRARHLAARPQQEFLGDPFAIDAAIREIMVLFETAHNVAKHLIAGNSWKSPSSKAEAFEILAANRVIPDSLVASFQAASRFRNLVTYQTSIVQDAVVHRILTQHLSDFEGFIASVAQWLKEKTP